MNQFFNNKMLLQQVERNELLTSLKETYHEFSTALDQMLQEIKWVAAAMHTIDNRFTKCAVKML